jgi:hypothetical protein
MAAASCILRLVAEHLEREFKLRIPDEAARAALIARLGGASAPPAQQVNHFFDTRTRALRRARLGLRLREEEGRFTLALKGPPREDHPSLAARSEEELELDAGTARALLSGERAVLEALGWRRSSAGPLVRQALRLAGKEPLLRVGAFENERLRIGPLAFPPGSTGPALVFELDRTTFPGGRVERELEVELPEGADPVELERGLGELFRALGIAVESLPSKARRLFRILDGQERSPSDGGTQL